MTLLPADLKPSTTFDLHLHTSASDGRYDIDEVLARCAAGGLQVIAITDHDLGSSLQPGPRTIDGHLLHVIPGAEVSGVHDGYEYHLLVYFREAIPASFFEFCQRQCNERRVRFRQTLENLAFELELPPNTALTRLHMAHALVEAGRVGSRAEAFARYLGHSHGNVPQLTLPFVDAIRIAREHGALTSWAHPPRTACERYLPTFVEAGLQGLEGVRPHLRASDRKYFKKVARQHGLYLTGGSDWHGWKGDRPGLFRVEADRVRGFVDTLVGG